MSMEVTIIRSCSDRMNDSIYLVLIHVLDEFLLATLCVVFVEQWRFSGGLDFSRIYCRLGRILMYDVIVHHHFAGNLNTTGHGIMADDPKSHLSSHHHQHYIIS